MSKVPLCHKSLGQHIRRVDNEVSIWKNTNIPPANDGHGWILAEDKLKPLWDAGDALPQALINISQNPTDGNTDKENDDDDGIIDITLDEDGDFE